MVLLFQSLPDYSYFGIMLVRLGLALWFIASASSLLSGSVLWNGSKVKKNKQTYFMAGVDGVIGLLFLVGAFTQIAALLGALVSMKHLFHGGMKGHSLFLFILLSLTCLAMLTLGPGPFSVDLPL